jgi:thymidylate kinase
VSVASELDRVLADPVLVFGSLPPDGADLDLLARAAGLDSAAAALSQLGFLRRGMRWARFRACSAEAVELVPAADWVLPPGEVERLFDDARPIPGLVRLVRPAPVHVLLILARRLVHADGVLDDRRRARLDHALGEDAAAWDAARRLAPAWRAVAALEGLDRAHRHGQRMSRPDRLRALAEEAGGGGAARAAAARVLERRRRGFVVAFSGLDGAGKSTQAEALREALGALGIESEVVWTSVIAHGSLGRLARPVKRVLALTGRGGAAPTSGPDETWSESAPTHRPDHGTILRRRSRLVTFAWTTVLAAANGWWQGRETRPRVRRGRVVICDRYTLDTKVHLRYEYGERRRFRFQMLLIRLLSPTARHAFLLDVAPETAHRRKGEYEPHQLDRRARLYREECHRLGAVRLDAERSREEICAEIARAVWLAGA